MSGPVVDDLAGDGGVVEGERHVGIGVALRVGERVWLRGQEVDADADADEEHGHAARRRVGFSSLSGITSPDATTVGANFCKHGTDAVEFVPWPQNDSLKRYLDAGWRSTR